MSRTCLWRQVFAVIACCFSATGPLPAAAEDLTLLSQPGPWSGISNLIGYDHRVWFANSVKYVNHNSADIYSYDPVGGETRYEAHLLSQDAGHPLVADGLLYWPFEDPRFTVGLGEYMVTDGEAWRWHTLPDGQAFHVHAMASLNGTLYAATSAWRAGLQTSTDGGVTWRIIHDHPTAEQRVTRITALTTFKDTLYAGLTDRNTDGTRLLRLDGETLIPVDGWPDGRRVTVLAVHDGWLYANNLGETESTLWRTDGTVVEPLLAMSGVAVRALASGPDALWAVSAGRSRGRLWRSEDGVTWSIAQRFAGAAPMDVAVIGGDVYVGTAGPDGRGGLWGPPSPSNLPEPNNRSFEAEPNELTDAEATGLLATLDQTLADPEAYQGYGSGLRKILWPLSHHRSPEIGAAVSERLGGPFPNLSLQLFNDNFIVTATDMARWALLRVIALNGHGAVPLSLIGEPWDAPQNDPEKYMEPVPAAAWTVARIGQSDDATLQALLDRLDTPDDPAWLVGDIVGALTALTGERFGYDVVAWRDWWADQDRR